MAVRFHDKIYEPVEVSIGDPISIEINQDAISFKKRYLESPWLGDYGRSLSNPRITKDFL